MKNLLIDPLAATDITTQVAKVLRGLDYPEPPLDLREVRELLKLDRQFYSTTNTGPLQEFISKMKVGAKQVVMRPTLIVDVVRKSGLKALWLPDRKRILIDDSIPSLKKRNAEAHEITHSITPHHAYFLLGDDGETLRPSCHEKLEAEANFGSSELLFLQDRFRTEALDLPRTIDAARNVSKTFGNTITMTLWRLVQEAKTDEMLFAIVSAHPKRLPADFDATAPCKYFIQSPAFRACMGSVAETRVFQTIQAYATYANGGPLGEGEIDLAGLDGERHRFHMETFYNRYEALTMGTYVGIVVPQVAVR